MNEAFSARLSALRKERGLSQKEAAEALGISGALLSHYEKGIRECGLQFICKAAAFYDVSCDYLLGVSNTRRSINEEFDAKDTAQDKEFRLGTMFRAAVMLNDTLSAASGPASGKLRDYFALSIYRVAILAGETGAIPKEWITLPQDTAEILSAAVMDSIVKTGFLKQEKATRKQAAEPLCVKTILENSERILQKEFRALLPAADTVPPAAGADGRKSDK